jgi:hypothetical protein
MLEWLIMVVMTTTLSYIVGHTIITMACFYLFSSGHATYGSVVDLTVIIGHTIITIACFYLFSSGHATYGSVVDLTVIIEHYIYGGNHCLGMWQGRNTIFMVATIA